MEHDSPHKKTGQPTACAVAKCTPDMTPDGHDLSDTDYLQRLPAKIRASSTVVGAALARISECCILCRFGTAVVFLFLNDAEAGSRCRVRSCVKTIFLEARPSSQCRNSQFWHPTCIELSDFPTRSEPRKKSDPCSDERQRQKYKLKVAITVLYR